MRADSPASEPRRRTRWRRSIATIALKLGLAVFEQELTEDLHRENNEISKNGLPLLEVFNNFIA